MANEWSLVFSENNCDKLEFFQANSTISPDYYEIPDHFPGFPVVPACMQLVWIEEVLRLSKKVSKIKKFYDIKFLKKLSPPASIICKVSKLNDWQYGFELKTEKENIEIGTEQELVFTRGKFEIFANKDE